MERPLLLSRGVATGVVPFWAWVQPFENIFVQDSTTGARARPIPAGSCLRNGTCGSEAESRETSQDPMSGA